MPEPTRAPPAPTSLLSVPSPIANLFKRVPLAVYPANDLPRRSPSADTTRELPILYIFTTKEGAQVGRPSFNPSCLKWQTVLKIARLPFTTTPSTNHASPSGALPFLLPPPSPTRSNNLPIPAGDALLNHAVSHSPAKTPPTLADDLPPRQEAYLALLHARLRPAFLHALYVNPINTPLLQALYVNPCTSNSIVRATLQHQVRSAAEAEILASTKAAYIDADALYQDAVAGFAALETLLSGTAGGEGFFSGGDEAGLFDAEVFAYTGVILDERLGWVDRRLAEALRASPGLVRHRERMMVTYFPEKA
ncbi:hypothetical protein D7B24_007558 [Verticillium nonalfalfae]|uniref:Thioredoxin-like fold domain-containing protein n=1 Tax=Verticillium nonalfalfae TaxID=1051616 RepID=A0A3M9Y7J8_9PEZI|nr:uncharacterized protein D7B24_007558 [Verticillium nonalfalfae]RNJ56274.1 hypothetical protein D7B24_007558 [Verticillium nonalfalfae]